MPAVAALLDSSSGVAALRRTISGSPVRLLSCRSATALSRACEERFLDSIVLGLKALRDVDLLDLKTRFPRLPIIVYAALRPGDGEIMLQLVESRSVSALVVEGVDDAVVGDLVLRHGLARERELALADAPRLLRLREDIQKSAWNFLVKAAGRPIETVEVADELGVSREHLSRQFGAGGAPNLKRVIDLLRVVCASQLLANPGHDTQAVSGMLGFSSTGHLTQVSKRITAGPVDRLAELGPRGILGKFVRVGMRSRR